MIAGKTDEPARTTPTCRIGPRTSNRRKSACATPIRAQSYVECSGFDRGSPPERELLTALAPRRFIPGSSSARAVELDKRTHEGEAQRQPVGPGRGRRRAAARHRRLRLSSMGGGGEEERRQNSAKPPRRLGEPRPANPTAPAGPDAAPRTGRRRSAGAAAAAGGHRAFDADDTVVLLFVHDGGIDDRMVAGASRLTAARRRLFVVPASEIARYAAITQGVDVNRVPALVVLRPEATRQRRPHRLGQLRVPEPQSVEQAVIDAGYRGPTVAYHPELSMDTRDYPSHLRPVPTPAMRPRPSSSPRQAARRG